ncbi:MAG: endonuclease III [Spirochaetes bacterium]|nr:MAG: endonuclease III [Spirochaetota bacterium]
MDKALSKRIFSLLKKRYGVPSPSLRYGGLYELAVSVVLSAQTTDAQVNAATPALFSRYPDFRSLADARVPDVERIIRSTGFYHNKARHIVLMAKAVRDDHGGALPSTREGLMSLPGIGRKSANVILSMGMGIPALAVDTHVMRVANRVGYIESDDPNRVEEALTAFIPRAEWTAAHLILITHGRTLCVARGPRCPECPVNALCEFARRNP